MKSPLRSLLLPAAALLAVFRPLAARADLAYFGPSPQQGAQIGAGAGLVAGILCFLPIFGGCLLAGKVVERKSHRVAFALASAIFTVLAAGPWLWLLAGPETGIWLVCVAGLILVAPLYGLFRALAGWAAWRSWILMLVCAILFTGGIASCASFGHANQEKALAEHQKQRRRNIKTTTTIRDSIDTQFETAPFPVGGE